MPPGVLAADLGLIAVGLSLLVASLLIQLRSHRGLRVTLWNTNRGRPAGELALIAVGTLLVVMGALPATDRLGWWFSILKMVFTALLALVPRLVHNHLVRSTPAARDR